MNWTLRCCTVLFLGVLASCGGGAGGGDEALPADLPATGDLPPAGDPLPSDPLPVDPLPPVDGDPKPSHTHVLIEVRDPAVLDAIVSETGAHVVSPIDGTSFYLVRLSPKMTPDEFIAAVGDDVRVVEVERDEGVEAPEGGGGTTPLFSDDPFGVVAIQTELVRIGAPIARERTTGAGVVVAVVDTGVDETHPLLVGHVAPGGYDFVDEDSEPTDVGNGLDDDGDLRIDEGVGHGTFVASLVLAVAPDARILPLRALDSDATGTASSVARAISHAVALGAHVVNVSAGLPEDLNLVQQAIQSASAAGVPVYASAGNRMSRVDFPAFLSQVQAVTSVDSEDRKTTWASYGSSVDLSAPGVDLLGAHPLSPSGVARWSGTSFSTPICAGAFALLRSQFPYDESRDLVRRIEDTAVPIDDRNGAYTNRIGKGRVDLDAATRTR